MIKPISLLLIFWSFASYAAKPAYDKNCVDLGKKWGWIKTFDPSDGHKRTYASSSFINNAFASNQDKIIKQLDIWSDVDKTIPCLKDHAGVTFQKGAMIIFDMQKFSNFRLNGSKINCLVTSKDTKTNEHQLQFTSNAKEKMGAFNSRVHAVADNLDTPALRQQSLMRAIWLDSRKSSMNASILREKMKQNNNFGDLGMENYCSHQLRLGIVSDKAQTVGEDLKRCNQARLSGDNKTLKSKICEGYPKKTAKNLKEINDEMLRIKKDKMAWQPLVRLNKADKVIYSTFENNYQKLQEARKLASKSMNLDYGVDNFLKSNNVAADSKAVLECGKKDEILNMAFSEGSACQTEFSPLTKLGTEFKPDIKVLKKLHEQNLISEMNAHAYGSAIKSKFYLLKNSDPLKSKMYHRPLEACIAISGKEMCKGIYFEAFKKSVKEAWNYKTPHFLSYSTKDVVSYYNSRLRNMAEFCTNYKDHKKNNLIEIVPDAMKAFEENYRQLISGEVSAYLFDQNIRFHAQLNHFRNSKGEYCQGFSEYKSYEIKDEHIENVREYFEDATNLQIKSSVKFAQPDRGNPSNFIGAKMCQKSITDKNDSFVLNSLYESHPHLAGKILKSLAKTERRLYTTVICEARECSENVGAGNETIKSAATVALIAANFIPVYGSMISFAGSMAMGVGGAVEEKISAEEEILKLRRALASEGLAPVYKQKIGDILKDLSHNASYGNLIVEIAIMTATERALSKGVGSVSAGVARVLKMQGIFLTPKKATALDIIVDKALGKVKDVSKESLTKAFEEIKDEEIEAPDFKDNDQFTSDI